jgi:hypothetical protein
VINSRRLPQQHSISRHGAFSGLGSAAAPVSGWETVLAPQVVQEPDALAK